MNRLLGRAGIARLPRGAVCEMTRLALYGVESGAVGIPEMLERHRGACLVCQAATVRQRQVIRGLASLRQEWEPLPYDMTVVLDQPMKVAPDHPAATTPARRRSVLAAVASTASIAAIGLVVVVGRRLRSQAKLIAAADH